MAMLHMANDSHLFRTCEQLEQDGWELDGNVFRRGDQAYLPLHEAKMMHHFDHRWATYDGFAARDVTEAEKADPSFVVLPRYWVAHTEVDDRLAGKWDEPWLLGWRDITNTTNERTVIASFVPRCATGDTLLLMFPAADAPKALLIANLDSFAADYVARQKVGGTHLKYHVFRQLAALPPAAYQEECPWSIGETVAEWMLPRVAELVCTADDLAPLAAELGLSSLSGSQSRWNPKRRSQLRCELDAAFFRLYGLARDEAEYVLDTFPIVQRKDEAAYGEYRTKLSVLVEYDAMVLASDGSDACPGSPEQDEA
jgi:hypothetical protein